MAKKGNNVNHYFKYFNYKSTIMASYQVDFDKMHERPVSTCKCDIKYTSVHIVQLAKCFNVLKPFNFEVESQSL